MAQCNPMNDKYYPVKLVALYLLIELLLPGSVLDIFTPTDYQAVWAEIKANSTEVIVHMQPGAILSSDDYLKQCPIPVSEQFLPCAPNGYSL